MINLKYICQKCGKEFEYHRKRKNCLECVPHPKRYKNLDEKVANRRKQLAKNVQKRREKIKEMAVEYKGGKCIICGYHKCKNALCFHHVHPEDKSFSIASKGITRAWATVKKELDKCVLVCSNCYSEIHAGLIDIQDFC